MFLRLLAIEIRKTFKQPMLWAGLAALLLLFGMFTLIGQLQVEYGYRASQGGLEQDLLSGLAFFDWIGILVYAVTASVISAFDYPDRSIQLWLARGVARPLLLGARLTAILFFDFLIILLTVIIILGFGALWRILFFGMLEASNLDLSALLPVILRLFWGSLPYLALTLVFAVLSRSPLFAAGATVLYGGVLERYAMSLGNRFPLLIRHLPANLARVLQAFNGAVDRMAPPLPADAAAMPELRAVILIGLLFLAPGLLSFVIFSRQDLGG